MQRCKSVSILAAVLMAGAGQAWGEEGAIAFSSGAGSPHVTTALAKGVFQCSITVVDPPVGSGVPQGGAVIMFSEFSGLSGTDLNGGIALGSGEGLDPVCQTLTEQTSSRVRALGCTASAIRIVENVGGNFRDKSWFFDVICVHDANRVVEAIGAILVDVVTAPVAQQAIQRTVPQSLETNDAEILRTPTRSTRQKLFPDR